MRPPAIFYACKCHFSKGVQMNPLLNTPEKIWLNCIKFSVPTNPCKCGYYPDRSRCNCSEQDIKRYMGKISMPLWDRFDMCIKTDEIGYEQIRCSSDNGNVPDSESMKQAVMRARLAQLKRFNGMNIKYNSQMSTGDMKRFCRLGEEEEKLIKRIFAKKRLTARGYSKILKTARTIADIDGNVNITTANISEAFYYRGIPEVTIH